MDYANSPANDSCRSVGYFMKVFSQEGRIFKQNLYSNLYNLAYLNIT